MMLQHGSLWSGSALCACAGRADELSASNPLPSNYTSPAKAPETGRAPRMQARVVGGLAGGPRTWALVFGKDDDVMSGLSDWAAREGIQGGHLQAIGSMSSALFGWFDKEQRAYLNIPVDEQVECISLNGDIGLVQGKPALHVHGCVVRRDGVVKGGHLLHAVAWPTLEVFATEAEVPMHKQADAETTLKTFQLDV